MNCTNIFTHLSTKQKSSTWNRFSEKSVFCLRVNAKFVQQVREFCTVETLALRYDVFHYGVVRLCVRHVVSECVEPGWKTSYDLSGVTRNLSPVWAGADLSSEKYRMKRLSHNNCFRWIFLTDHWFALNDSSFDS